MLSPPLMTSILAKSLNICWRYPFDSCMFKRRSNESRMGFLRPLTKRLWRERWRCEPYCVTI